MTQLPDDFVRETRLTMGEERFSRFLEAFDEEPPISLRLNPRKAFGATLSMGHEEVPWCKEGCYLEGRPQFTFDPLFHAGCYYVQEAASMFISHILRQLVEAPVRMLDLCAAPGGKSTAAIAALPEGSRLVSNEPNPTRAQILLENITKWGWPDCTVTNNYPRDFRKAKQQYDLILCDVPCSGEGMFRKDMQTISEWSPQNVEKCWRLQREIVADAWQCLVPGGILIYSTCTFNTKENEENIRWILEEYEAEVVDIPTEPSWGITGSLLEGFNAPVYRFIPGITRSEGLFVCVMRKSGKWKEESGKRKEERGKRIVPQHQGLNVCSLQLPSSTLRQDVPYSEALRYLRGEALVLPPDTPRSIVTITYRSIPLGPVKNIGNRANNLYPKPWRIKTTHLPEEPIEIITK